MSLIPPERDGDALITGQYRYWLRRWWGSGQETLLWVLLNPSWANAQENDATLNRLIGYSVREGYTHLEVVNLFALRNSDPRALLVAEDPKGMDNDLHIVEASRRAHRIIVAWGNAPFRPRDRFSTRDREVLNLLYPRPLWCFGTTQKGGPLHPLYLSRDRPLVPFPYPPHP
ncbi:hypothetical protein KDA_75890 [Dictyobacter alpinus]|uniref:DUF1643 domain-containing protein n=1 Tax=Dictyobacter alpinus TaxID=2014873 RepID=A0A402BL60_9CHLR|nr:hypothetical protein KDA_75890 [Dictyobacter alpinus]